jgi:hypothetical protein
MENLSQLSSLRKKRKNMYCVFTSLEVEHEGATTPIRKSAIGHISEPVPSTSYPQNTTS